MLTNSWTARHIDTGPEFLLAVRTSSYHTIRCRRCSSPDPAQTTPTITWH